MTTPRPTDPHLAALRRRWRRLRWSREVNWDGKPWYRESATAGMVKQTSYPDDSGADAWTADFGCCTRWGRTPVEAASRAIRAAVRGARRTLAALAEPDGEGEGAMTDKEANDLGEARAVAWTLAVSVARALALAEGRSVSDRELVEAAKGAVTKAVESFASSAGHEGRKVLEALRWPTAPAHGKGPAS